MHTQQLADPLLASQAEAVRDFHALLGAEIQSRDVEMNESFSLFNELTNLINECFKVFWLLHSGMRLPPIFANDDNIAQIQVLKLTIFERLQQAIHYDFHLLRKHARVGDIKL